MSNYSKETITSGRRKAKQITLRLGCIKSDETMTLSKLAGATLHCTFGNLWVTIEDDPNDHVLATNQSVLIPNFGKVIISGEGSYRLDLDGSGIQTTMNGHQEMVAPKP